MATKPRSERISTHWSRRASSRLRRRTTDVPDPRSVRCPAGLFELHGDFMEKHTPSAHLKDSPPSDPPTRPPTHPGAKGAGQSSTVSAAPTLHPRAEGAHRHCQRCGEDLRAACLGQRRTLIDSARRSASIDAPHQALCAMPRRGHASPTMPGPLQYGPGIKDVWSSRRRSRSNASQSMPPWRIGAFSEATLLG